MCIRDRSYIHIVVSDTTSYWLAYRPIRSQYAATLPAHHRPTVPSVRTQRTIGLCIVSHYQLDSVKNTCTVCSGPLSILLGTSAPSAPCLRQWLAEYAQLPTFGLQAEAEAELRSITILIILLDLILRETSGLINQFSIWFNEHSGLAYFLDHLCNIGLLNYFVLEIKLQIAKKLRVISSLLAIVELFVYLRVLPAVKNYSLSHLCSFSPINRSRLLPIASRYCTV